MPLPMPRPPSPIPEVGDERSLLTAFLDHQRAVMLRKVAALDEQRLRHPGTPSGLTLLGMVKHLAYVERFWFRSVFAGDDVVLPWTDDDPDADWRPEPDDTVETVAALYRDEIERARAIVAAASLDDRGTDARGRTFHLRWIVIHMIEETARHLGHADVIREAIDGATGD
jgi:uncharacterized damage-inducible protein DinB